MKNLYRLKNVVFVFILGITSACMAVSDIPEAAELIDKYSHALDSTSSFIEEYEKTTKGTSKSVRGSGIADSSYRGQLRYDFDSQRIYAQAYGWGAIGSFNFDEDKPNYTIRIYGREMNYQNNEEPTLKTCF